MLKRICKITFITHGSTVHTMAGIIGNGLKYPKLNEIGEEELERVCSYLEKRGVSYDKIYTSPNTCCTQSAQIVAKLFKQKATTIDLLPRNYGDWQGMLYSDILKNGAKSFAQTPENGESIDDFNSRISDIINQLVNDNKGSRIIIVTTPDIVQSALAKTLQLAPDNQYKMLIKPGSLTQISYFDNWSSVIYSDYCPL